MPTLRNPNLSPPGGWRFYEARTALLIESDNENSLIDKVIDHRKHKGFEPIDRLSVRSEIESQICARLGSRECRASGPDDTWKPVNDISHGIGASQVLAFTKFLVQWFTDGGGYVEMAENQRRRAICANCPLNNPMKGCSCAPLYAILSKLVPSERRFADLHVCGVCGCSLQLKCASPSDAIAESEKGRNLSYPANCWVPSATAK